MKICDFFWALSHNAVVYLLFGDTATFTLIIIFCLSSGGHHDQLDCCRLATG